MSETKQPSRREFLKGSTAALASTALVGGLSIARTAHAAGGDEIKIALVGCGGRGTGAAVNCLSVEDNLKLVAVADAFEDRAKAALQQLQTRFGGKVDVPEERVFVGFDAYRGAIDSGADLVLLVTPPGFRPMQYKAAVEAGKHVFMEKPVCVDAPGFRSVMETNRAADQKNLKVAVGLNSRHTPPCVETVKRVHDGAVGEILFERAYGNNPGVWVRPRTPAQTEMEYQMRNWYYFVWLCGDLIVEQHVHLIDLANWLKQDHPVEANGMGGREVRKGKDHGQIFDHHFVEYTYADGSKMFSQCRHIAGCANRAGTFAHGPDGVAATNGTISGKRPWQYTGPKVSGHQQEHVDLIEALRKDLKYNEGWFGATSSMTAVLGRMATYSGKVVAWDEAVEKGPDEMPKALAFSAEPPVLPDAGGNYPVPVPGVYQPY
ncbi:MAG: Gfo/Idh/MocA family oxidoreductase [Pirellulales bacterium]|nr:Gfo/Idh/MocA family oxidoreductase [Pirellulales bacterium]